MKPLTAIEILVVFFLALMLSVSLPAIEEPPAAPAVVFTEPAGADPMAQLVELQVLEVRDGQ